jgi:hypothetical protein
MGEAKNWEKLGSCALEMLAMLTQIVRVKSNFFITAIMFFHWSDGYATGILPLPAININVVVSVEIASCPGDIESFRIRNGKIQQNEDPEKSSFAAFTSVL